MLGLMFLVVTQFPGNNSWHHHPQCMTIRGFGVFTCARVAVSLLFRSTDGFCRGEKPTARTQLCTSCTPWLHLESTSRSLCFLGGKFSYIHAWSFVFHAQALGTTTWRNAMMIWQCTWAYCWWYTMNRGRYSKHIFTNVSLNIYGKIMVSYTKMLFKYTIVYGF